MERGMGKGKKQEKTHLGWRPDSLVWFFFFFSGVSCQDLLTHEPCWVLQWWFRMLLHLLFSPPLLLKVIAYKSGFAEKNIFLCLGHSSWNSGILVKIFWCKAKKDGTGRTVEVTWFTLLHVGWINSCVPHARFVSHRLKHPHCWRYCSLHDPCS